MSSTRSVVCGIGFMLVWGILDHGILQSAPNLRGSLGIHDPSTIIKSNGRYYVFGTGQGIISRSSADKEYWVSGPSIFSRPPSWTTNAVSGFTGFFWAPDIIYYSNSYHLYYAVSTFGSQISGIGLATNPVLDPNDPGYLWTDQGPVIQSDTSVNFNAIDPSVTFDAGGNLWLAFGSYWTGIKLIQLDPATGKRITTNSPISALAYNSSIEASCIYHRGTYYYLFVNWGTCCSGMDSSYNIRVGRSSLITGPYQDRNGISLAAGGGTMFLKATGKYIGPGHVGILDEGGTNSLSYHYYDGNANGAPTLDLEPLSWTSDNWPVFTNDWAAVYRFQSDGRDEQGQYYGLLQNGASVRYDPQLGGVLDLRGSNRFVNLPDGAANARTFVVVFKWDGGADWQRLFDFGRSTASYAFLTPRAANGRLHFAITSSGGGGERVLDGLNAATPGVWTHAAVTTDGVRGILYVNGQPVVTNSTMTLTAADLAPTNTWLGRSQFTNDPWFSGQISSMRIYGRALTPAEIVAPQAFVSAPPPGSHYQPGSTVRFGGSATDFADAPLSATGLVWTVEFHHTNSTTVVLGPVNGVAGGELVIPSSGPGATNGFYRIILSASDTLGRSATNSVDILPGASNADWVGFYPFDNGAADSGGLYSGSLVNGASTPSDPIRGPVLNLSGANQYVNLPAGIGGMRTYAAWLKWGGGGTWQRLFDFGGNTTRYAMLTSRADNGALRFEITAAGGSERRQLDAPAPLPTNVWTHVAVTLDGRQAVMFVNGQAVAVNAAVNLLPADAAGSANYLGRSQFPDPYFNGRMDSVQLSSRCLTIEEITASRLAISNSPAGPTLSWPVWNAGPILHSTADLISNGGWTPVTNTVTSTNGIRFITLGATNAPAWFRLQLP